MDAGREFEIGSMKFKLIKMNAFKQFHVARKLAPILSSMLPSMKDAMTIQNTENLPDDQKFDQIAKLAGPILEGLSKLSEEDADKVLHDLLASAEIQQKAGNWARISNGQMLMFSDLELPVLLRIAGQAFMYNLQGFFSALPQK